MINLLFIWVIELCNKKTMKLSLKTLITGSAIACSPALLFWGAAITAFLYKQNFVSDFYNNLPVIIHALILIVIPALVLLAITITKNLFEQNNIYKLFYAVLRRFTYFTIVSSILLFTLTMVFSRS